MLKFVMFIFFILVISFAATFAEASCDIEPLRKEFKGAYESIEMPVYDLQNKIIGKVSITDMKVSEHLMVAKYESFLVGFFSLKLPDGKTAMMTVLANVDEGTCKIDSFNRGDLFGSSVK